MCSLASPSLRWVLCHASCVMRGGGDVFPSCAGCLSAPCNAVVRMELYRYRFSGSNRTWVDAAPPSQVGRWWTRWRARPYLPAIHQNHAGVKRFLQRAGA